MLIEKDLTISMPKLDTVDIHPRSDYCDEFLSPHSFILTTEAAGFKYQLCCRCGTVRVSEMHR